MKEFILKADTNGAILAGELYNAALSLPGFTVEPVLDLKGNLQSGSFHIKPKDFHGIDEPTGHTYANPDFPFELEISVTAVHWPDDTDEAREKALCLIFKPLLEAYNKSHSCKATLQPRS
jgi:hypothetical protein